MYFGERRKSAKEELLHICIVKAKCATLYHRFFFFLVLEHCSYISSCHPQGNNARNSNFNSIVNRKRDNRWYRKKKKNKNIRMFFLSKTDLPGQGLGYFIKYWKKVDSNLQSRGKDNSCSLL